MTNTSRRRVGWLGVGFAILLLLSASMASPPRSDRPLAEFGTFFNANRTVILIAQALGIGAAVVFALFVSGLAELLGEIRVQVTGLVVATAAAITSLPLIVMSFQGSAPSPTMVNLTDLTDAVLFLAIAVFFGVLAGDRSLPSWIRGLCVIGASLTLVRGYLGFEPVFSNLDVIAPLSFVLIVVVLAGWAFRVPPGEHQGA